MKYLCEVIRDLLPLYYDKVCSKESNKIVDEHLGECESCKHYLKLIQEEEALKVPQITNDEKNKRKSFQEVNKMLKIKQMGIGIASVVGVILVVSLIVGVLKNSESIVEYNEKITVVQNDNDLVMVYKGGAVNSASIKRVEQTIEGEEKVMLFFYITENKWDALTTSSKLSSEVVVCEAEKGAADVDEIYYYVGSYDKLEDMSESELKSIIEVSEKLWDK